MSHQALTKGQKKALEVLEKCKARSQERAIMTSRGSSAGDGCIDSQAADTLALLGFAELQNTDIRVGRCHVKTAFMTEAGAEWLEEERRREPKRRKKAW